MRERAQTWLAEQEAALRQEAAQLGLAEDLLGFEPLDLEAIVALGRKGILSLDDLADLAADELIELLPDGGLTEAEAGQLIMAARAHWFGDAEAGDAEAGDGAQAAEAEPAPADDAVAAAAAEPEAAGAGQDGVERHA